MLEAARVVDHSDIGECDDHADTGNGHQVPGRAVRFGSEIDLPIQGGDLLADRLPGQQQWLDDHAKGWVVGHDLTHPDRERPVTAARYDKAKGLEQAANVIGNRLPLRDELSTRHQQHSQRLSIHALDGNLAEPSSAHDLRQPMRVIGIGFVELQAEGSLRVAGIDADDGQTMLTQLQGQPVRHLPGLQADAHSRRGIPAHELADRFCLGAAFASPYDGAALIDDADRGGLKRHVKADIVLLIHGNASGMMVARGGYRAIRPERSPRLRHVPSGDLEMQLRVEPAPFRTEGIGLLIDEVQAEIINPKSCDADGCTARFPVPPPLLSKLLGGKELDVQYRFETTTGTSLPLELPNLEDGIVAMHDKVVHSLVVAGDWTRGLIGDHGSSVFMIFLVDAVSAKESGFASTQEHLYPVSCTQDKNKQTDSLYYSYMPLSVEVSVGNNLRLAGFSENSSYKLKEIVQATRNCGDQFAVMVTNSSSNPNRLLPEKYLLMQKIVLRDYLLKSGLSEDKVWMADAESGVVIRQPW